jgi:hypothetical protein
MKRELPELASQMIRIQLEALRLYDSTRSIGIVAKELAPLFNHQYATQGPLCWESADCVSQVVHVRGPGGEIASFRFQLRQSDIGWRMDAVTRLNDLQEGAAELLARHFRN